MEGAYINLQIVRSGNVVWIRSSSYSAKKMTKDLEYNLFKLFTDLPAYSLYRRVYTASQQGFVLKMSTDGQVALTPFGADIEIGDAVNFSEVYITTPL